MRVLRPVEGPEAEARPRPIANPILGMLLFVIPETMIFAGLISAFSIVRAQFPLWPPPDQPRLPVEETAINTVALLLSAVTLYLARRNLAGDARTTRIYLTATMLLGGFFVVFQGVEWVALIREGLTLTSSTLGSFFYLIVGLHGLHAVVALGLLAYAWTRLQRGWLSPTLMGTTQIFWYFVVAMWPVLYWRVYL